VNLLWVGTAISSCVEAGSGICSGQVNIRTCCEREWWFGDGPGAGAGAARVVATRAVMRSAREEKGRMVGGGGS
jgi:hypothetical protein